MTRLRPYWVALVVVAAVAAAGLAVVANEPAFHVHSLEVAGLERVARGDVLARAAIDPRANIWLLDKRAIEARIERSPYVATAALHRMPPGAVRIEIVERTPSACVRDVRGRTLTLDASDRLLADGCVDAELVTYALRSRIDEPAGAFLHDAPLAELERDASTVAASGGRFRSFAFDRYGELVATLRDGIAIEFGDDGDLARKSRLISPILAELGPRVARVKTVDVRAPATPVVEFGRVGG